MLQMSFFRGNLGALWGYLPECGGGAGHLGSSLGCWETQLSPRLPLCRRSCQPG